MKSSLLCNLFCWAISVASVIRVIVVVDKIEVNFIGCCFCIVLSWRWVLCLSQSYIDRVLCSSSNITAYHLHRNWSLALLPLGPCSGVSLFTCMFTCMICFLQPRRLQPDAYHCWCRDCRCFLCHCVQLVDGIHCFHYNDPVCWYDGDHWPFCILILYSDLALFQL